MKREDLRKELNLLVNRVRLRDDIEQCIDWALDGIMGLDAVEYKFSLSAVLISGLHKLDKAGGTKKLFELPMTKGELVNFARIRFFGLAINNKEGVWQITKLGEDFLQGSVSCKKCIYVKNNKFVKFGGDDILISDVKKIDDIREYYKEQARAQKGNPDLFGWGKSC